MSTKNLKEECRSSASEDEYDFCEGGACAGHNCLLPFDYTSIEKVILKISDYFYFRVVLNSEKVQTALFITAECVMAGSLIGKQYEGKIGAAVGGAVEEACEIGIVAVSMRLVWAMPLVKRRSIVLWSNTLLESILNSEKVQTALFITAGCVMAGSLIGKHYGGKIGAAVGGAVGGACGVGLVVVSMRDVWEDIKLRLYDMFDIVYDYLAGLGLSNYKVAMQYLMKHEEIGAQLASIIIQSVSGKLGKKILSNLI